MLFRHGKRIPSDDPTHYGRCPVCACIFSESETVVCSCCATPHHADCWTYAGGCAIFGCAGAARQPDALAFHQLEKHFQAWSVWTSLELTTLTLAGLPVMMVLGLCIAGLDDTAALFALATFVALIATTWFCGKRGDACQTAIEAHLGGAIVPPADGDRRLFSRIEAESGAPWLHRFAWGMGAGTLCFMGLAFLAILAGTGEVLPSLFTLLLGAGPLLLIAASLSHFALKLLYLRSLQHRLPLSFAAGRLALPRDKGFDAKVRAATVRATGKLS